MPHSFLIRNKRVTISNDGQTLEIEGMPLPLETLLAITEKAMTGSDLLGTAGDSVDPRFKFTAVMSNLYRIDGEGAGASRFKAPHYLTMG